MNSLRTDALIVKNMIREALDKNTSLLIGKIGTIECNILYMLTFLQDREIPLEAREVLEVNAGVFPCDLESVRQWGDEARNSIIAADCLATGWYENTKKQERELLNSVKAKGLLNSVKAKGLQEVSLRSLEPYYDYITDEEGPWTTLLTNQSVCVVSSFTESAKIQIQKGEKRVWLAKKGIWPSSTKWHWVQTGYAPILARGRAGWEESPESWSEAVSWVVAEVLATDARIIIIGCGGLGMLIGARLKAHGKICLVLGGATQVLFGIKGRRWENHPVISAFWNSEWVWPSLEETPAGACEVENSCYWG